MPSTRIKSWITRYEPISRNAVLDAAAGMLLGLFSWMGYRQLSIIDPFDSRGTTGLLVSALIGGLIYRKRAKAVVWTIAGAFGFMIVTVAYTPIMHTPFGSLVRSDSLESTDALVVLSSFVTDDEVLDQQGTDRLLTGLQLVKHGVAPDLVVTRVAIVRPDETLSSVYDQVRMFKLAGSPARLFMTSLAWNTHDEAVETRKLALANGWKRIAVVTSPAHTKRACATFEKAGMKVVCVPALSRDLAVGTLRRPADRLRAFQLWLYESLATSEYKRRGWI